MGLDQSSSESPRNFIGCALSTAYGCCSYHSVVLHVAFIYGCEPPIEKTLENVFSPQIIAHFVIRKTWQTLLRQSIDFFAKRSIIVMPLDIQLEIDFHCTLFMPLYFSISKHALRGKITYHSNFMLTASS